MKCLVPAALLALVASFIPVVHSADPLGYFPQAVDRTPYEAWLSGKVAEYDRHIFLSKPSNENEGAAIFWKIHQDGRGVEIGSSVSKASDGSMPWIQFAIVVQASEWVGFGLSEAGGMLGADMAIFQASDPTYILDAYVVEERLPQTDDCQHWELLNATVDEEWIILEIARDLETGDLQDHPIRDDSSSYSAGARLITAWGSDSFGYHGQNVVRSTVKLFAEQELVGADIKSTLAQLDSIADGSFEVREANFSIPAKETTYHTVCVNYEELLAAAGLEDGQSVTLIGASPIITPETAQFVHHFVVYYAMGATSCDYDGILTAWAPGESGMHLPENVGIPIFGEGETKSIMIEIHYNNPEAIVDQLDSSGMRFFFSFDSREHEAAYFELGDPLVQLKGESIGEGLTEWSFECDSSCSAFALGASGEPATVFAKSLHMHKSGTRMVNEVIRDEKVVHTGSVDVFEFHQQGAFRVPTEPFQIMPGDKFRTTCYYRDGTKFGSSSQEEMCIAFLLYYPAKRFDVGEYQVPWMCAYTTSAFPICTQKLSSRTLSGEEELQRGFGSSLGSCESTGSATTIPVGSPVEVDGDESINNGVQGDESGATSRDSMVLFFSLSSYVFLMSIVLGHF